MYYQIVGNYGPQSLVVSDLLKKSGIFFNNFEDLDNDYMGNYTHNSFLEDYYRPFIKYDTNQYFPTLHTIDQGYKNELISYIRSNHWNNKGSCNLLDMLISPINAEYNQGSVINIVYSYEDMNLEFLNLINFDIYNIYSNIISNNLNDFSRNGWNIIDIDYKKFLEDPTYQSLIYQILNISNNINLDSIYIKYHDTFIKQLSQHTISNIFNV
jgi:hypothetical protein